MEAMGTISGGAIVVKKYQASAALTKAGVLLESAVAANSDVGGVALNADGTTALTVQTAGVSLDTCPDWASTGLLDTNDIVVSVAVNPDLIIKCKMTAGTTADVALTPQQATADATGADTAITSLDEGIIWGYSGANKGEVRRATDTTGGAAITFPNAILSSDFYLHAGTGMPGANSAAALFSPDLTDDFTQAVAEAVAPADNDMLCSFDLILGTEDDDGANNSFWLFVQNQNAFGCSGSSG
jgi:hypothetical protein